MRPVRCLGLGWELPEDGGAPALCLSCTHECYPFHFELRKESPRLTKASARFAVPMVGEICVRNAAMANATPCGSLRTSVSTDEYSRDAQGAASPLSRRTSMSGSGPALEYNVPRAAIKKDLADALTHADGILIGPVDRPERFAPGETLDRTGIARDLTTQGRRGVPENGVDSILSRLREITRPGDVVAAFQQRQLRRNLRQTAAQARMKRSRRACTTPPCASPPAHSRPRRDQGSC